MRCVGGGEIKGESEKLQPYFFHSRPFRVHRGVCQEDTED